MMLNDEIVIETKLAIEKWIKGGVRPKDIYDKAEVQTLLNLTRSGVEKWVNERILKAYKINSKMFFFRDEIFEMIKKKPLVTKSMKLENALNNFFLKN